MTKAENEISRWSKSLNSLLVGEGGCLNTWTDEELRTLRHCCQERTPGEEAVRVLSRILLGYVSEGILEARNAVDPPR